MSTRHEIHIGSMTFYQGGSWTSSEWETAAKELLDRGQPFLAYDLARMGLGHFPDSLKLKQVAASGLIRTGALEEAKEILEPLFPDPRAGDAALGAIYGRIRNTLRALISEGKNEQPTSETLELLARAIHEVNQAGVLKPAIAVDEETLGLLGRVYKETWKRTGALKDAVRARDAYLRAFELTGGYWTGINAATISRLMGEHDYSKALSQRVLGACRSAHTEPGKKLKQEDELFWIPATMGEAHLLLENRTEAVNQYREAVKLGGKKPGHIVSALQQLLLLRRHERELVPDELLHILKPPTVIVFSGHMLDKPGHATPRFPDHLERAVGDAIRRQLDELDARIGYSFAACGSDILFAEAMLERGAELNILLPFHMDDFVKESVAYAGPRWVNRFHATLKLAHSVRYVTEERYLGDEALFDFAADVLHGYARLGAQAVEATPYLVVVLDEDAPALVGGTADVVARWSDEERLRVIRIAELRNGQTVPLPHEPQRTARATRQPSLTASVTSRSREIRTMLFADVVGYSKLGEEHMPFYIYEFMERVAKELSQIGPPEFVNTWGDALFAVMNRATPIVEYALALHRAICTTDWSHLGLPEQMSVRIGLHAGPVFRGKDPITGRLNIYGSHVNRAARIEPVTLPGYIYASEQFAALLAAEQTACEKEAQAKGQSFERFFVTEYVGTIPLAKAFGEQRVHQIRTR